MNGWPPGRGCVRLLRLFKPRKIELMLSADSLRLQALFLDYGPASKDDRGIAL